MKHIALLLFAAVAALGQATQNTTIQPDCWIPFSFTAAASFPATPVLNGPGDNRQKGCSAWTFKYQSDGFSGLTITVQSGESASTTVSFGTYAGTVITGANPMTSTSGAEATFKNATAAISWVRVTLSGLTGSGTVSGVLYGFRNNSAAVNSSGSGNCPNASANAVLKSDGTNCVASGFTDNATTISTTEALDFGGAPTFEVPNSGAPGTTIFGQIAGDNNAWAASRGAAQWFDGTANTYIVGALASDTPTNGQVPTWNTGGTITWETISGFSWTNGATGRICYYVDATHCDGDADFTFNGTTLRLNLPGTYAGTQGFFFGPPESDLPVAIQGYSSGVNQINVNNSGFSTTYGLYHAIRSSIGTGGAVIGPGGGAGSATGSEWDVFAAENGDLVRGYVAITTDDGKTGLTGQVFYSYGDAFIGTGFTSYTQFYGGDLGNGNATSAYLLWGDTRGVYRIKADNTFNSVYQNIAALYNPQFTKYTPGAANYERCVPGCQWNSNVAEIGNEAGGTGTLRAVRMLGPSFEAVSYKTATNCADSAGAAACGSAAAGAFVLDVAATSVVVSTTAVTAVSRIKIDVDSSVAAELGGITCNTTPTPFLITAKTAGVSFTLTDTAPVGNPRCFTYTIVD